MTLRSVSIAASTWPVAVTACQPRDRVWREIRAMHPFSQSERFRCQRFDHAGIEQIEPGGPQLEQQFAASFDLLWIEVLERLLDL